MHILWVTPFSKSSAIGQFSRLVTNELCKLGLDVTIASCEADPPSKALCHETSLPLLLGGCSVEDRLHDFDVVVYNIGNNYQYHGSVLNLIERRSGLFIFHDLFLHDLFWGVLQAQGRLAEHDRVISSIYGDNVKLALPDMDYGSNLAHRVANYPMFEWFAPRAIACVVHGKFGVPILENLCAGPVTYQPLAFFDPDDLSTCADTQIIERPRNERFRLTTFGDVNPNKRVDSVIRAIGSSDFLRSTVEYSVIGRVSEADREYLTQLAASHGVTLRVFGRVDSAQWEALSKATDVSICLRFPTTETASATVIESMLNGLPVVVTDTGFYRDLPNHLVFKVEPSLEEQSLRDQLERLALDFGLRKRVSQEGKLWARETFSSVRYAAEIKTVLRDVVDCEAAVNVGFKLADVATQLGLLPDDSMVVSWIERASQLLSLSHVIPGQTKG